ncbi:NAD(P)H-hydrate epimerase-like [Gordionus sp. m RMFG-2023]|uniref:NAD(P)H-hydrate epimerase-like n=1 Tax=Gordionus sp. m RMFG-2023 TaxID=3053472 RepID=UPI0031FD258D
MARQYSQESQSSYGTKCYLSQSEAKKLDEELMGEYAYTLEQLMELAGLSCAEAILSCYPLSQLSKGGLVLVCCGPGNNGGDGLVCARHLRLFGYKPSVYYPVQSNNKFFSSLKTQIAKLDIPFLSYLPREHFLIESGFDFVVDALFGFGFSAKTPKIGEPAVSPHTNSMFRPPFDDVIGKIAALKIPVISLDVPSGWDVDGRTSPSSLGAYCIRPDALVSLTAPKECSKYFKGRYHFLGGRFLPPSLKCKCDLKLPDFPGGSQCVDLNEFLANNT